MDESDNIHGDIARTLAKSGYEGIHTIELSAILDLSGEAQDLLGRLYDGESISVEEAPECIEELHRHGITQTDNGRVYTAAYIAAVDHLPYM